MAVSLLGPSSLPLLNLSHLGLLHLGIVQACETVCLRPKPSCCLPKPVLLLFLTQVNMPSTDTESQSLCSLCCIDFSHSTNHHFYFLIYFKTVPFSLSPWAWFDVGSGSHSFVVVVAQLSLTLETPLTAAYQASLSFTISWSLLKLMSIKLVMPSNHLILCHPLLLLPQFFPASGSFPVSQLFALGGQSIGALASALVLLMNIQGTFPLGLSGLISLLSKGLSRVFSNTTVQKDQFFGTQPSLWPNSHLHIWLLS